MSAGIASGASKANRGSAVQAGGANLRRRKRLCIPACVISLPLLLLPVGGGAADVAVSGPIRVQNLVDDLRAHLSIPQGVRVSIVSHNPLLVSVSPPPNRHDAFELSFEKGFLDVLDADELKAVVAHELGHVWIFTHHPFLQTEQLANRVAMRVVSRDSLERVYDKVWKRGGVKGDLATFLGG